jgi:hypothetical protein
MPTDRDETFRRIFRYLNQLKLMVAINAALTFALFCQAYYLRRIKPLTAARIGRMQPATFVGLGSPMRTLTLDFAADIARPAPRSPDNRAALAYLAASGAVAINVDIAGTIKAGKCPAGAATFWIVAKQAVAVRKLARKLAGKDPDLKTSIEVLHQAAAELRITLTPNEIAISRATMMAGKIEQAMEDLHWSGKLKQINKLYRTLRLAAKQRGEGFMSFKVAEARLRQALVPVLMSGQRPTTSLFETIFRSHTSGASSK